MDKPRMFLGSSTRAGEAAARGWRAGSRMSFRSSPGRRPSIPGQHIGAPPRAHPRGRFRGVCVRPGRLDGEQPAALHPDPVRARRRRVTMSCSKPACSAACSACAGPSSSMPTARSFRPTSSASPAYAMPAMTAGGDEGGHPEAPRRDRERGPAARIEGSWWQFSLTARTEKEPSALGLLKISRDRSGALEMTGRAWREDGGLSARYRSEAAKEKEGSRASSITGRASGRWTRMRRSSTEPARSGWNPGTAHPAIGRPDRTGTRT